MESELLKMMFTPEHLQAAIDKARDKKIEQTVIEQMGDWRYLLSLKQVIKEDKYNVFPPHIGKVEKDTPGEFREVYINEPRDRIILTLINDCLCELMSDMIHPACRSYQKGMSSQSTVQEISNLISGFSIDEHIHIGFKSDFSKYFDTVKIEVIDGVFDEFERRLGFEKNTEPVINMLRRYYHQDLYFDLDGNLQSKYQSLKQGCAVASILANVCLYDLDEYMSSHYEIYYRYSDDCICLDKNPENIIDDMNAHIAKYGMVLNPKKVQALYSDEWFKFLGFDLKGSMITLSPTRIKKFKSEIDKRTIFRDKRKIRTMVRDINRYLFVGDYCWASSCLGTVNVEKDLQELNKYVLDAIVANQTGKKRIGGLGANLQFKDSLVARGKGRNVRANRDKRIQIDGWIGLNCMAKAYKTHKGVYESLVRDCMSL